MFKKVLVAEDLDSISIAVNKRYKHFRFKKLNMLNIVTMHY